MPNPPTDQARLTQFLEDEVRDKSYADLLLDRSALAAGGRPQLNASGNAYNVDFGQDNVVITHHYLQDWPAVRLAPRDFIAALERRRARL
jgi:hypothetical protein